jgi:hypothetical protein
MEWAVWEPAVALTERVMSEWIGHVDAMRDERPNFAGNQVDYLLAHLHNIVLIDPSYGVIT